MQTPPNEITQLLRKWSEGDRAALDQLMPVVYQELRKLANAYLRGEKPGHTLQPTALINEAYLRLVGQNFPEWQSRKHFCRRPDDQRVLRRRSTFDQLSINFRSTSD